MLQVSMVQKCQEFRLGISQSSSGTYSLGQTDFDARFAASRFQIIRRSCASCGTGFQDIYYRRLTAMPSAFSAYKMMACEWTSTNNVGGTDFKLYSTLADAIADTNAWSEYGFGGTDVGFPGTSGPSSASSGEFSSIPVSECSSSSTATGVDSNFYIYVPWRSNSVGMHFFRFFVFPASVACCFPFYLQFLAYCF